MTYRMIAAMLTPVATVTVLLIGPASMQNSRPPLSE
eukprot:CAMPEP_0118834746 /NCGR_PEP_ID=MMETSP1162-20130426/51091_1 /TAXON_ID=33656 /ORGANISM="Phaeocystis Sp, Strain CCMP2710" /LENGTH=35 /DNA_ID= /DNA_START= /DNA_END= /DNA_ORIENTATION=